MNRLLALSLALAAAVSVSACQTPQQQNALVGGTLGAGTGALVGSAVSGGNAGSTMAGAAIGAGTGALIGAQRRRRSPSAAARNGPTTTTATRSASPSTEGRPAESVRAVPSRSYGHLSHSVLERAAKHHTSSWATAATVRVRHPQQSCRSCALQLKRDGAAGAVLKSWMQGWRVTCRACGAVLADVWNDENRAGLSDLGQFEDEARAGEEIVEAYAGRRQSFQVSPAAMLRLKRETLAVVAEGVASAEVVDAIYTQATGAQPGPFRLMDAVGLDVVLSIEENHATHRPGLPEEPRVLLKKMIAEGHLGVKSGRGFYAYP